MKIITREEVTPKSYPTNLLQKDWSKRKCFYYKPATEFMAKVHEMEVREDDVWVITLPKCGTTWLQELLWLVMNDFDFEGALNEHLEVRTPFLEFEFGLTGDPDRAIKLVNDLKSPRLIKSHLPLPLLPKQLWEKKPKIVYIYRHPIDALVSMYYHARSLGYDKESTVESSLRDYMGNDALYQMPFDHVAEFFELRNEPWVYYTSFGRMKSNLSQVILDICKFLNKPINDDQLAKMLKHLSFEEMQKNPKTNHLWEFDQVRRKKKLPYEPHNFIRKGKVNGYKEEIPAEFIGVMEKWITDNLTERNLKLEELLLLDKNKGK